MAKKKEIKAVGGQTEGMICSQCFTIAEENELRIIEGKVICDNCDIEPTLEKSVKENDKGNNHNSIPLNTFAYENDKSIEKVVEITNIDELNSEITIPRELNIIDCPDIVNSDVNWFRIQFKNFWRLFTLSFMIEELVKVNKQLFMNYTK